MCGRMVCSLCKGDLQKACSYKNEKSGKYELPNWWNNPKCKKDYSPSYNVAPTDVTSVIVSGKNFNNINQRMLVPMMWGMIPPWHKGNYNDHRLSTNNARYEGLIQSKLYSKPLNAGNRCVVVCDGFYEWQTKIKGEKHPYFIYMTQDDGVCMEESSSWKTDWDEVNGWKGPKLLHMAGLYNIWTSKEGDVFYSYSIITTDADDGLSWLHHRMPAILEGKEIDMWLDIDGVTGEEAFSMLHPVKKPAKPLKWHPVATLVNNSRNKDPSCNKPIVLKNTKKPSGPADSPLMGWLKMGTLKREKNIKSKDCFDEGSSCSVPVKKEKESPEKIEADISSTKKIKLEEIFIKKEKKSPEKIETDFSLTKKIKLEEIPLNSDVDS